MESGGPGVLAAEQRILGVPPMPALGLRNAVFRHAPPSFGGFAVSLLGQCHHLAIVCGITLERDEALLGHQVHDACVSQGVRPSVGVQYSE